MISNSLSCPLPTIRAHRIPFENLTTLPNFTQLSQRYRNIVRLPNPIRESHHTPELHSAFATISKYRAITEPHSRISPHSRTSLSFRNNIEISCNHRTPFENFITLPNFAQLSQRYRNIVQSPNPIRKFHHTPELHSAFTTISKYRAAAVFHSGFTILRFATF